MLQYFQQAKFIQEKYTLEDFLFRWKKLERVIEKETLDGLLIITGQHSLDSNEAAYLFNWLFLGLSGKNILTNKYLHQNFSELIILIHAEQSFIFLPPKAKHALEHLIYGIPNCTIYSPTENQYNNKEVLDTLKITFFYQMVQNKKSLGVFLQQNQDPKGIQKWPLIQSYALEPVGKTFFTLQYKVSNLSTKISTLFKNLDKHSLKNLVSQTSFSMQGHIKGATNLIQLKDQNQRKNITQKQIQQSLQETVDIALLETSEQSSKQIKLQQKVKVLFGDHTINDKNISLKQFKCQSHYHLTLQHYDPYTEFQVWRTYFFGDNLKNSISTVIKTEEQTQSFLTKTSYSLQNINNTNFANQRALILMYLGLVQGTLDAISAVSKDYRNLNTDFIKQQVLTKINQIGSQVYEKPKFAGVDLEVWLESYDSFGEPRLIDFKDVITFKLTSTFYVLKCKLNNVSSPSQNINLGSLVFSQCFLLQEGCFLLLTKNISYFDFWACQRNQNQLLQNLNPNYQFQVLGKSVFEGSLNNRIFVPLEKLSPYHFNIPLLDVKYFFHELGIRIYSPKFGWRFIFYKEIDDLTLVDKIPGQWVLFRLKQPFLFQSLESNVLFIQFRGKAFQILLKKINDKQNPLKLNYLEEIPPILSENWYFTEQVLKKQVKKGALLYQSQILQQDFLWSFIEAKQLMILNMKDIKLNVFKAIYQQKSQKKQTQSQNNMDKYNLILVLGAYASNKIKLAQTLVKFGPSTRKYSLFRVSSQNLYSRIQPSAYLQLLDEHINDNKLDKSTIVISIIPSWLDCSKTIPLLSEKFHVRAVITKVTSNNFFANKNKNLVENVLTYCLPGYSQNIILDASAGDEDSLLSSISKILWVFNSQAKISRANNGVISTGQCTDIVKDESFSNDYNQFLRNKYSAFYKFDSMNSLSINYLDFKLPIYDFGFVKTLTKSNGYLIDYATILTELKDKKSQAQNSKDQLMLSLYQIEESITIQKRKQKVPHIRELKGVIHINQQKGDKQFVWANREFRERNVEENSKAKGLFIISKNYNEAHIRKFLQEYTFKKSLFEGIKQKASLSKLTEIQRKAIERDNRSKYLQNGDYFDGYFYRDVEGYILAQHPGLNKILEEWMQGQNKSIQEHNSIIRKEWSEYLKKYE